MEPENMKILYNSSNINITPARYLGCSESKVVPFENFLRQIMFKVLMSFGRIFDLIFFKNPPQFDNDIKRGFLEKTAPALRLLKRNSQPELGINYQLSDSAEKGSRSKTISAIFSFHLK